MGWRDLLPPFRYRPIADYGFIRPYVFVVHQTVGDQDDGADAVAYMFSRDDGIRWHWTVGADGTAWKHAEWNEMMAHALGINSIAVGVEHDMKPDQRVPEAMYETSARICAAFCRWLGKEPSREFVIGHDEDHKYGGESTHTDPGPTWDWVHYMGIVRRAYGGDEEMTDAEKARLEEALQLGREANAQLDGMTLRLRGEPEPANAGPKRSGWRKADAFLREPSA